MIAAAIALLVLGAGLPAQVPRDAAQRAASRTGAAQNGAAPTPRDAQQAAAEAWQLAERRAADGDVVAAAEAARAALADAAPGAAEQRRAFELGLALLAHGEDEAAAALQRALHERAQAPWSAHDLAQTLARLGRAAEADAVLGDALARWPRDGVLWNARGLMALGAGDVARARQHLGAALRCGDLGSLQTLARLAFAAGDVATARTLWRPGVDAARVPASGAGVAGAAAPSDWALRGWALTLLPARP